ncbi:MAG: MotA/TolQ/ExbB proton channel family protein [Actinomycetota bacterium]|nr:MotA/TolQ/ExbB proton channel family protein [Actinomycetota bacterium]
MDVTTIIGIIIGLVLVTAAIMVGGDTSVFFNAPSLMITFGGTIAATLIHFKISHIMGVSKVVKNAFSDPKLNSAELIATMVRIAERARKEGLLALEEDVNEIGDSFLERGMQLVIDGADPELVQEVMETEIIYVAERHALGKSIIEAMASYAPSFGMLGTLIGLVKMLHQLNDPSKIGPGMAIALLTTLYGALFAYLFLTPMAGKLGVRSAEEVLRKELIVEGILAVQAGHNPRMIEEKLKSFLSPEGRESVDMIRDRRVYAEQQTPVETAPG